MKSVSRERRRGFNDAIEKAKEIRTEIEVIMVGTIQPLLEKYNEALDGAREEAIGIAESIDDYVNERSDKWQESERGSAFNEWSAEWSSVADGLNGTSAEDAIVIEWVDLEAIEEDLRYDAPEEE